MNVCSYFDDYWGMEDVLQQKYRMHPIEAENLQKQTTKGNYQSYQDRSIFIYITMQSISQSSATLHHALYRMQEKCSEQHLKLPEHF